MYFAWSSAKRKSETHSEGSHPRGLLLADFPRDNLFIRRIVDASVAPCSHGDRAHSTQALFVVLAC